MAIFRSAKATTLLMGIASGLYAQAPTQAIAPQFNAWTILLSVVASVGLLSGIVLLSGRSRFTAGEKWLAMMVLSFALMLWSFILFWTNLRLFFPYLNHFWPFFTYLTGPALLFYLKDSFDEKHQARERWLHFAWPLAAGLLMLPVILTDYGWSGVKADELFGAVTAPVLIVTHLVLYATAIHRFVNNEWQVDTNILLWTKTIVYGMWAYTGAFVSYFVLIRCSFFSPQWDYAISTVMALGILVIAYMGFVQKRVFRSEPIQHFLPGPKYQYSMLTVAAADSIRRHIERLLQEDQVFKENELRLDDLAAYLNINRHQLSQVINTYYGVNFFELINQYRIQYVKTLLENTQYEHMTIMQIAYESGFNNKVSFNRYFKKAFGMTPSAYRLKWASQKSM
jgi:AraC-like DNA-binding protein